MATASVVCPHCFVSNRVPENRMSESPACGRCGDPLFTGRPIPVNQAQFRKMLQNNSIPVIVDYWASWCGPCRAFAPVFEQAAKALEPQARLLKLDTEANHAIAANYSIQSIPTIAVYQGGVELHRHSGALSLKEFINWVTQLA